MKLTTYTDRAAWLAARRKGLGGSDVPAVLGISPWRTPLQVWAEKVGLAGDDDAESYAMRRGSHMEGLLWREFEREVPNAVAFIHSLTIVEGAEPWMRYSPDAIIALAGGEGTYLGEGKSHPRGASEWQEGAPPHVVAQVQWGMHVCDLPAAYVAVDLGTEFKWQRIERDAAWWPTHEGALREFWRRVEREEPPEPTGDEGDRAVLLRMWPREETGKAVTLSGPLLEAAERLSLLRGDRSVIEGEIEQIENTIRAHMADAETALLPDGSGFRLRTESRPRMVRDPSGEKTSSRVLRRFAAKGR